MHTASRRHLAAGVALVGASVIAVTPIAPPTPHAIQVANAEVALTASAANILPNLVNAVLNIPYYETQATNKLAASLFFSGTWLVASATNVWGTDPGDTSHYTAVANVLLPNPAFADTLGAQLAAIVAAELPADESCAAEGCSPVFPTAPITGVKQIDQILNLCAVLLGLKPLPLINNWFQVPLSELLSGYTFPDRVSPSGVVYEGFGSAGTSTDPDTGKPLVPWSGETFTWDPLLPFANFYDSLTADPDTTGVFGTGVHVPTSQEIARAVQALLASVAVAFWPAVPGSPVCAADCAVTEALTLKAIVKFIGSMPAGNPLIDEWLAAADTGTANGPTDAQVVTSIDLFQRGGIFNFDDATNAKLNAALAKINPVLPAIAAHSGLLPGKDQDALTEDIKKLLGIKTSSDTTPTEGAATAGLASPWQKLVSKVTQPVSATSIPSPTPNTITMDVKAAPAAPDSGEPKNLSTVTQRAFKSIERAIDRAPGETPATAAEMPTKADPKTGQTPESASKPENPDPKAATSPDKTKDGNTAGSGQADRNGTKFRGGLDRALKSARERASAGVSKSAGGSTGGTDAGDGGGRHRAE